MTRFYPLARFFVFLLSLLCLASPLRAATTEPQSDESLSVRLISALNATGNKDEVLLGLDIKLEEGVHTYWRSSGIAGAPPTLDWTGSDNFKEATLLYPAPHRASFFGVDSIGYNEHVTFPIRLMPQDPTKPLNLVLNLNILVCKELCLPKQYAFSLSLPAGQGKMDAESDLLKTALEKLPSTKGTKRLSISHVTRTENKVYVAIKSELGITSPDLFIETPKKWLFAKPEVSIDDDKRNAVLTAQLESTIPAGLSLTTTPLTLTIVDGNGAAVEANVTQDGPLTEESAKSETVPSLPLWSVILFALLGGMILNLMPCVLPVLSLKILSVVKHGGNEPQKIRHSFLSTGTGVVVSFLLLAGGTILLKQGGQAFGWGVQFQQPTFLVFMITLLTLFAANLWGFFEITLPRFLMDNVDPVHHPKLAGDFATGMLATLLATPCSAPFLGTAIGFALSQGAIEILLIFAMLGIGMAMPYFLIALWPRFAAALPKPGFWMIVFTRLLGFGLAGTAIWLLFVLYAQIGRDMTALISLGMIAVLVVLFMRHKNILRILTLPAILLVFAGSLLIGLAATVPESLSQESGAWEKFDEAALHRHVREGKTVFLDITADWCITCKANKRFTLARESVANKIFNAKDVIAMQGNWTSPDPLITAFLQKEGRYGIPFNAVYGPKAPEGILLPELLTPDVVLDALDKAKGPSRACPADLPKGKNC